MALREVVFLEKGPEKTMYESKRERGGNTKMEQTSK
jgi:hypothetical protein